MDYNDAYVFAAELCEVKYSDCADEDVSDILYDKYGYCVDDIMHIVNSYDKWKVKNEP